MGKKGVRDGLCVSRGNIELSAKIENGKWEGRRNAVNAEHAEGTLRLRSGQAENAEEEEKAERGGMWEGGSGFGGGFGCWR
jgi:hypothetical protein